MFYTQASSPQQGITYPSGGIARGFSVLCSQHGKLPNDTIVTHVCNEKNFNGNFSNLDMKIGTIRDL